MKNVMFAWMALMAGVCYGGQEASVLVSPTPAPAVVVAPAPVVVTATPVVVSGCTSGCCGDKCSPVYTAKTDERSSCRRTVFGKVVRRDVKRTVVAPVR
jgi:hypothetical protein